MPFVILVVFGMPVPLMAEPLCSIGPCPDYVAQGYAKVHVTEFGKDIHNALVYLFTETGSYLGQVLKTDSAGMAMFLIPANAYKFRVDYGGKTYWSDVAYLLADEETTVDLKLDLLALDLTNDPNPVRFDGIPPVFEPEPVRLASLFDITGILARSVVAQIPVSKIYYYINDHLGTSQKMVDESGTVVWSADYRPFGEVIVTANGVGNGFRFPGQHYDQETGLHYNYLRYYDPFTGRYLKADPIGFGGGINLFTYVLNNPIRGIDPFGLAGFGLEAGGGLGVGGYKDSKSKADNAASGIYLGAKPSGHAELGAYTYKERTKIGGGKLGLGVSLVIYWEDAEKFFKGITRTKSMTIGPITQTWYYNECEVEIGRSFSFLGKGGGLSYEEGESEGMIFPLQ